ncbi:MAG: hypothetical protein QXF58_04265 [Desulfurococcaceae archaeon]
MNRENGVYRGGTAVMQVKFYGIGGRIIVPSREDVVLEIYDPKGILRAQISGDDINVDADGTTWTYVTIPEDAMTGVWVCLWKYADPVSGKIYITEMPFIVSDPAYR